MKKTIILVLFMAAMTVLVVVYCLARVRDARRQVIAAEVAYRLSDDNIDFGRVYGVSNDPNQTVNAISDCILSDFKAMAIDDVAPPIAMLRAARLRSVVPDLVKDSISKVALANGGSLLEGGQVTWSLTGLPPDMVNDEFRREVSTRLQRNFSRNDILLCGWQRLEPIRGVMIGFFDERTHAWDHATNWRDDKRLWAVVVALSRMEYPAALLFWRDRMEEDLKQEMYIARTGRLETLAGYLYGIFNVDLLYVRNRKFMISAIELIEKSENKGNVVALTSLSEVVGILSDSDQYWQGLSTANSEWYSMIKAVVINPNTKIKE